MSKKANILTFKDAFAKLAAEGQEVAAESKRIENKSKAVSTVVPTKPDQDVLMAAIEIPAASQSKEPAPPLIKPETRPDTQAHPKPHTKPLNHSLDHSTSLSTSHSASLSTSHSASLPLNQAGDRSVSQLLVSDRLTDNQKVILSYLLETRPYITRFALIGQAVGMREATVRTVLRRLEVLDFLSFRRARDGQIQGIAIKFNAATCEQFSLGLSLNQTLGHALSQPHTVSISKPLLFLEDKKIKNLNLSEKEEAERLLTLSDGDLVFFFPNLAKLGFGIIQLRQVIEKLEATGKSSDRLQVALEHANYEWGPTQHLPLTDASGNPIMKPLDYVFSTLARTGYYRRPEGYISPDEQAELDQEAELRALANVRERVEQAKFDAWLTNLADEEREKILEMRPGYRPGRPKGVTASTGELAWLKSHWIKTRQT